MNKDREESKRTRIEKSTRKKLTIEEKNNVDMKMMEERGSATVVLSPLRKI